MRIWLDAERLAAFGIAPEEVESALARNNFLAAVGQAKGGAVQVDLLADTDLRSVEEFERLIVREDAGQIIRIADIGTVELGSEEASANVRHNGKDAVYLSVWPLPGANEIAVAHALRAELAQIAGALPPGTEISLAYDGTVYMENALKEIGTTLSETIMIVGLIVFLFLGSVRTALVPLVAIPISLIGATAAMLALGFSLNLLTLLAIVLAVGLVVDDAIVVVENVAPLHARGHGPRRGGADQLAPAVRPDRRDDDHARRGLCPDRVSLRPDRRPVQGVRLHAGDRRHHVGHRRGHAVADHERLHGAGERSRGPLHPHGRPRASTGFATATACSSTASSASVPRSSRSAPSSACSRCRSTCSRARSWRRSRTRASSSCW